MLLPSFIILLSLAGAYISWYVLQHKLDKKPLVCSINHQCDDVVNSKYGKTFGIENSVLGLIYFLGMATGTGVSMKYTLTLFGISFTTLLLLASIGSAIFSLYLLGVMVFKLKERCDWCIGSTAISVAVFGLSLARLFV